MQYIQPAQPQLYSSDCGNLEVISKLRPLLINTVCSKIRTICFIPNCNFHVSLDPLVLIETEGSGSHLSFRTTKKPLEANISVVVSVPHRFKMCSENTVLSQLRCGWAL